MDHLPRPGRIAPRRASSRYRRAAPRSPAPPAAAAARPLRAPVAERHAVNRRGRRIADRGNSGPFGQICLFSSLDLVPVALDLLGPGYRHVAEHVRMPPHQLGRDPVRDVIDRVPGAVTALSRDPRVEHRPLIFCWVSRAAGRVRPLCDRFVVGRGHGEVAGEQPDLFGLLARRSACSPVPTRRCASGSAPPPPPSRSARPATSTCSRSTTRTSYEPSSWKSPPTSSTRSASCRARVRLRPEATVRGCSAPSSRSHAARFCSNRGIASAGRPRTGKR